MLHWKVWNYFVISHLWRNLIGFFEKCEIFVILIWLAKLKFRLQGCHRNVVGHVFNFGRGRRRSSLFPCFFELEREQPACFLIATCWQNTKNIKRRCSVFSKVETLAVCCESGSVSVTRSFESTQLGACLAVTPLCSLCLRWVTTTRGKCLCKQAWIRC